jgi:YjbE family integral membrane protein
MTFDSAFHGLSMIFQVFLLDLILSGDNAVVIALSCRSLPPRQLNQALLIGTGAAIGLRVLLTTVVSVLLKVPMLKLIGAVLLIVIGIRLLIEEERGARAAQQNSSGLWSAVMTVIVADVVMSLDNVVALSAVTQGDILYLTIGLILSVLLLMFSSKLMINLLHRYPILIQAAGALLGYIAGGIAVSDPAVADWVNTQSPALTGLVPLLCAVFVVAESRIIQRRRRELPRPAAREAATMRPVPPAPVVPPPAPVILPPAPVASRPADGDTAAAANDAPLPPEEAPDWMAAPMEQPQNVQSANRFGISRLIRNPLLQATMSTLLALFCIVFLPKTLDILILIGIIALMLFKIF